MNQGKTGEIYNLGSNKAYSIQLILNWLAEAAQTKITVTIDPKKFRPLDIHSIIADNDKVCALGWQPTSDIKSTILRILTWWRQQIT
jgi:GDP-4-dehydro-6-deoxy-D-mannose reductase